MSDYESILLEKEEGIGTIILNRPEKLNAFTAKMGIEFHQALQEMESDPEVRVVVITGAGRAFSAGADVAGFAESLQTGREGPAAGAAPPAGPVTGPMMMRNMSKPVIASINGVAVGMGFTISLACDIRIASEKARLGAIFARMGLIPEYGSTYNLARIVGIAKACELVFTARIIDAAEAKEIGLVNQLVPAEELNQATTEMASTIAKLPPFAIQLAKRGLYQGLDADLPTQLQFEALGLAACFRSPDHAEAVRAFIEKREPKSQTG